MLSIFCTISSAMSMTGKILNDVEYASIANKHINRRHFVMHRPYFSGGTTPVYWIIVKASNIRKDALMAATAITFPTSSRVVHVSRGSGCLRYIIVRHVGYMGSCEAAVKICTKARSIRKLVVAV